MAEPQLGKVEAGDERIEDADKGIGRDVVIHAIRRQQACLGAIDSFNEAVFKVRPLAPCLRLCSLLPLVRKVLHVSLSGNGHGSEAPGAEEGGGIGGGGGTSALGRTSDRFFSPPEI
jgi:hypothetical protein